MVMITSKRAEDGDGETAGVEESHKIQKCVACSSIIRNPCSNKQHGSNPCMPPCVVSYTGVAIKVSFSGSANSESCASIPPIACVLLAALNRAGTRGLCANEKAAAA